MMSLTFGLFTQVSGSGPLGPLVLKMYMSLFMQNRIRLQNSTVPDKRKFLRNDSFQSTYYYAFTLQQICYSSRISSKKKTVLDLGFSFRKQSQESRSIL